MIVSWPLATAQGQSFSAGLPEAILKSCPDRFSVQRSIAYFQDEKDGEERLASLAFCSFFFRRQLERYRYVLPRHILNTGLDPEFRETQVSVDEASAFLSEFEDGTRFRTSLSNLSRNSAVKLTITGQTHPLRALDSVCFRTDVRPADVDRLKRCISDVDNFLARARLETTLKPMRFSKAEKLARAAFARFLFENLNQNASKLIGKARFLRHKHRLTDSLDLMSTTFTRLNDRVDNLIKPFPKVFGPLLELHSAVLVDTTANAKNPLAGMTGFTRTCDLGDKLKTACAAASSSKLKTNPASCKFVGAHVDLPGSISARCGAAEGKEPLKIVRTGKLQLSVKYSCISRAGVRINNAGSVTEVATVTFKEDKSFEITCPGL